MIDCEPEVSLDAADLDRPVVSQKSFFLPSNDWEMMALRVLLV